MQPVLDSQPWRLTPPTVAPSCHIGKFAILLAMTIVLFVSWIPHGKATRPPESLKTTLKSVFPSAKVRLDGVIETSDGSLFIPLIPKSVKSGTPGLSAQYPQSEPTLFAFTNGWYYLKLIDRAGKKILALPPGLKADEKQRICVCSLPQDLIVPSDMAVVPELKNTVGELTISIMTSSTQPEVVAQPAAKKDPVAVGKNGIIAVASPQTGKIVILGNQMEKLTELPTDGTPGGMACADGKLFIADQTKNRVLIVDTQTKEFSGQIDFPPGSGPKDIAAPAEGPFLYVSECAANKVAIVELATRKIMMHTFVPAGPTRLALTPNGYTLIVLNVPAAKVSFISTLNQKVIGVLPVGTMPNDVAITNDSRTAFITNRLSNTISVIDITQKKLIRTVTTGEGPTGIALNSDNTKLFIANAKDNTISVLDLPAMTKNKDVTLPIDVEFPSDIMMLADGKHLLVTSAATDTLGVLNAETLEFEKQPKLGCTSVDLLFIPQ